MLDAFLICLALACLIGIIWMQRKAMKRQADGIEANNRAHENRREAHDMRAARNQLEPTVIDGKH